MVDTDAEKKVILVADDVETNRIILRGIFKAEYNVVEAADGVETLEMLRTLPEVAALVWTS